MQITNPTYAWLHSQSPAEMVRLVGGADGPQRGRLEKWVNECRRLNDKRTGMKPSSRWQLEHRIKSWSANTLAYAVSVSERCSLLRCLIPPPRTCPACEGWGFLKSGEEPCEKCGGTEYEIGRPGGDGTGVICEPPAIDPRWLTAEVLGLVERIAGKERCEYCNGEGGGFHNDSGNWLSCGICDKGRVPPDYSLMPILADALEDAGADDAAMLSHCRDEIHAAGCWVIEALTKAKGV